jgi:hypothetical protein
MADFLDMKVKEIDARLRELKPLVDEHERLEKARQALAGVRPGASSSGTGRRRGRPPGSKTTTRKRRGRRRAGNTRAAQTLELVRSRPGVTIPELAGAMKIKPNYLYRILPGLESEGQVRREGKGWHAPK